MTKIAPISFSQSTTKSPQSTSQKNDPHKTLKRIRNIAGGVLLIASIPMVPYVWNGKLENYAKGQKLKGLWTEYKKDIGRMIDAIS